MTFDVVLKMGLPKELRMMIDDGKAKCQSCKCKLDYHNLGIIQGNKVWCSNPGCTIKA